MARLNRIQKYIKSTALNADVQITDLSMMVCGSRTSFWERARNPGRFRWEELQRMFRQLNMGRAQQEEFLDLMRKEVKA